MTFDPYVTLNVRRNASAKAVTRAFRKRSMETHPDRGGDPSEFQLVRRAYAILSDPGRRARYDATGDCEGHVDNSLSAVMGVLSGAFAAVMETLVQRGDNPATEDIAAHIRQAIGQRESEIAKQKKKLEKARKFLETVAGRFTTESEDNLMDQMVRHHLTRVSGLVGQLDGETAANKQALDLLARFKYRADVQEFTVTSMQKWMRSSAVTSVLNSI